jgi:hypothetical protein
MEWAHPYDQEHGDRLFSPIPNDVAGDGAHNSRENESRVVASGSMDVSQNELPSGGIRRGKQRDLNWERYKSDIKRVYIDQNSSLEKTMDFMKENHNFDAS